MQPQRNDSALSQHLAHAASQVQTARATAVTVDATTAGANSAHPVHTETHNIQLNIMTDSMRHHRDQAYTGPVASTAMPPQHTTRYVSSRGGTVRSGSAVTTSAAEKIRVVKIAPRPSSGANAQSSVSVPVRIAPCKQSRIRPTYVTHPSTQCPRTRTNSTNGIGYSERKNEVKPSNTSITVSPAISADVSVDLTTIPDVSATNVGLNVSRYIAASPQQSYHHDNDVQIVSATGPRAIVAPHTRAIANMSAQQTQTQVPMTSTAPTLAAINGPTRFNPRTYMQRMFAVEKQVTGSTPHSTSTRFETHQAQSSSTPAISSAPATVSASAPVSTSARGTVSKTPLAPVPAPALVFRRAPLIITATPSIARTTLSSKLPTANVTPAPKVAQTLPSAPTAAPASASASTRAPTQVVAPVSGSGSASTGRESFARPHSYGSPTGRGGKKETHEAVKNIDTGELHTEELLRRLDGVALALQQLWDHPTGQIQKDSLMLHRLRALFAIDTNISRMRVARECSVRKQSISLYLRGLFRGRQEQLESKIGKLVRSYFSPAAVASRRLKQQQEVQQASLGSSLKSNPADSADAPPTTVEETDDETLAGADEPTHEQKRPNHHPPSEKKITQECAMEMFVSTEATTINGTGISADAAVPADTVAPDALVAVATTPPRPLSRKARLMQWDIDFHTRNGTLHANDGPFLGIRRATRRRSIIQLPNGMRVTRSSVTGTKRRCINESTPVPTRRSSRHLTDQESRSKRVRYT